MKFVQCGFAQHNHDHPFNPHMNDITIYLSDFIAMFLVLIFHCKIVLLFKIVDTHAKTWWTKNKATFYFDFSSSPVPVWL